MKKFYLSIATLISLIGIVSCGENVSSIEHSSDSSSSEDTSSIIDVDVHPTGTVQEVYSFLQEAALKTNYTLRMNYDNQTLNVSYNSKYIYYDLSDAGYVEINSYNNEPILYNFSNKAKPVLENAVSYVDENNKRVPITSTSTLNALKDGMEKTTSEDIQVNWDYFYSKNTYLIEGITYIIGASKYTNGISAVKFQFNDDKTELSFSCVPNFSGDEDIIDSLSGTILNVGSTKIDELDSFVSSYSLPSKTLDESILSSLEGKQSFTSAVYYHHGDVVSLDQQDEIVIDETRKQTYRKVSGVESKTFSLLSKDSETGRAISTYVSYDNKVINEDTNKNFDEVVFHPFDLIEKNAFRETSTGVYTYYGYQGRELIRELIDYEPGEIFSVSLEVKNNKITSLHALSTTRYDSYGNNMFYDIVISFQQDADFNEVKAYTGEEYNPIGYALNSYASEWGDFYYPFTMLVSTDTNIYNYKTKIYVVKRNNASYTMDTIIVDKESVDTSEGSEGDKIHIITGYALTDEGLLPFKADEELHIKASGPVEKGKKLKDFFNMDISSLLFSAEGDEEADVIKYKLHDNVNNIANHVFGGDNIDSIIPSSLEMTVSNIDVGGYKNKVLTRIEYEFNGNDLYKGKEHVEFNDYGTATVPSMLDFTTLGDWVEPTTWKEGSELVYNKLKEEFTDEQIAMMPYLYRKEIEGNWNCDVNNDGTYIWVNLFNDTYAASDEDPVSEEYLKEFESLLRSKGFVEKKYPLANEGEGVQLYKDGLYVRITSSLMAGIRFLIII